MKNLVVLSGAGISAESGLKTFRDSDGLWEGHQVMDVATPEGFRRNPELVLNFYNERRKQVIHSRPNIAHQIIADLEAHYQVWVVTQNVDDLHERAGSKNVLHLHGELLKVRSSYKSDIIYPWTTDLKLGDRCEYGSQLRPHIVWFGEDVPMIYQASHLIKKADILIVIGTSLQVYPAAGLLVHLSAEALLYYIDPKPQHHPSMAAFKHAYLIEEKAVAGMEIILPSLLEFSKI
ncbi:MAG: NAD-dependent deacylase [Saprospiraceae bacterium]|nr:NAD-dependent deacylase [Saprospiraceae bacterium]